MALQLVAPWRPPWPARAGQAAGWPLLLAGLWLGGWAVRAAGDVDLERPPQLVQGGPYAFSRNPMYVAWTLGYAGAALVAHTAWPLAGLPVVLAVTGGAVRREERSLERRFGPAYRAYLASVRRYL
jgi:protein-S-isoprenylcysteine O-methyltransferase Ste14